MARLSSSGEEQSNRAHRSGRVWVSWPPLPPWLHSATMATLVVFAFLCSSGVQGKEGVPAGIVKGEGVSAAFHGKVKIHVPTHEADAKYLRRLAAATGADRALNWYGDPCSKDWLGIDCNGDGRVVGINASSHGLTGSVPSTEGDDALFLLVELNLSNNSLSGPLPHLSLPLVERLYLHSNAFTKMPTTFFFNISKVRTILISNNTFIEAWPLPDLRSLTELSRLEAWNTGISGHLMDTLGKNITTLDLSHNHLTGPIPETFASDMIQRLNLRNNKLTGAVRFIEHIPSLSYIHLDHNNFSGPMPDFDEHMFLVEFTVAHNSLTGLVPVSLRQFPSLDLVCLSGNMLQGPVPVFAGEVQTDVIEATRTGSFCRLDPGPCDPDVDALLSIAMALHFPVSLADSWRRNDPCAGWVGVHCATDKDTGRRRVTGINLSRMFLNGTIDPAFASLLSLETIVLSGNNISGTIPLVLTQLPSLRILDLSDNVLEGSMPKFSRSVEVWAEGNPALNVSSVSPPSTSEQPHFTAISVVVAVLMLII